MSEPKELKPKYGTCHFCGQMRAVDLSDEEWALITEQTGKTEQELADTEATLRCKCPEGLEHREREEALGICRDNIEGMFGQSFPEVADLLKEAMTIVYGGKTIRKIVIQMPDDKGIASISYGKTGLKIEHKKVLHAELSTGF